jgi:hypothetical protein
VVPIGAGTPNGAGDGQSAQAQAVVDEVGIDEGIPWDAWGPRATAVSVHPHIGWRFLVGERKVTVDQDADKTYIRDYNAYRIRQARAFTVAKGLDGHGTVDSREGEGTANTFHLKGTRRIIESRTIHGGEWFEEDVTTSLPHLESEVDLAGCRYLYMGQDKVLLRVDGLDKVGGMRHCDRLTMHCVCIWLIAFQITGRPNRMGDAEAIVLYNM